ncbi:hypothetical protein [Lysinibacillus xylanilyticus]|uniref:hypothetical protein n=1 Tax=Lysinibacillus xylanilyticus TaxID=582475 RepID=UPI003D96A7FC
MVFYRYIDSSFCRFGISISHFVGAIHVFGGSIRHSDSSFRRSALPISHSDSSFRRFGISICHFVEAIHDFGGSIHDFGGSIRHFNFSFRRFDLFPSLRHFYPPL